MTLTGLALAVVGARTSPLVVLGVPVVLVVLAWAVQRPIVAALLVPLALPLGFVSLPGGLLDGVQASLLLLIMAVAVHRLASGRGPLPAPPGAGVLLVLLGLVALAVPSAPDLSRAVHQFITVALATLAILAIAGACRDLVDVRRMVAACLVSGLAVCATALPQSGQVAGSSGGVIVSGATGIFTEHNQLGGYGAAILVLAAGTLFAVRGGWARAGVLLTAGVALGAVALALSRGAYLGTVLGIAVLLFLLPQVRRRVLLAAGPLLLALGLFAAFVPDNPQVTVIGERLQSFSNPQANPEDDRPAIWAEAFRQIELDPLTGSGPANFPVVALRAGTEVSFVVPAHAHDVPLTVAAEVGLPAAGVLLLLTFVWTRRFVRTTRRLAQRRDRALSAALAGASATFVGQGIFDATLRSSMVLVLLALCVGLALAVGRSLPAESRP